MRRRKAWYRRRPVKRATVWSHRWLSIAIGLVLLVVTTTGVPILYAEELLRVAHGEAYDGSGSVSVTFADARSALREHDTEFSPQVMYLWEDVYIAENYDDHRTVTVDAGTGQVLGEHGLDKDAGALGWTVTLFQNIHMCGLTCEDYAGYQGWISTPIPGTGFLGFEGEPVSWGALIVGITALLLLFLCLSGIWLWWPGVKKWTHGVRVRMKGGRYKRDYDLHQVVGMIALPLLLLWAVTGAGYMFGFVEKAWFAAVPGEHGAEVTLESKPTPGATDIGVTAAIAAAQRSLGITEEARSVDLPAAGDRKATYGVWFSDGYDPYGNMEYAGDKLVAVDRWNADVTRVTYGSDEDSMARTLWDSWNFPTHAGWVVTGWWRLIWLVLGLVPLLLAFTGLSTWLYKRGRRTRRRTASVTA